MNSKTHSIRAVAALAAVACAGDHETDTATGIHTQLRDSAGIRIVENASPPEGSRLDWQLGPEPLVSIGKVDGEDPYLFTRIFGATMLSDGRIVIGDDGTKELRVFDQQGNHLETWGGQGQGPGEFTGGQLWGLAPLPGDSIIILQYSFPELTVFGPDGEFLRRFVPESSQRDTWNIRRNLLPQDVSRDGLVLAVQDFIDNDPADVEVWDAAGELRGSLGLHPGREAIRDADGAHSSPVMFYRNTFVQAWGDLFVISTNHRYELRLFELNGSLARIVRLDRAPRAPTDAHIEAYIESQLSSIPSDQTGRRADRRRALLDRPVAEHLPAFTVYWSDRLEHLWVWEYEAPGEEEPGTLYTIFDPEGRALGYFEIPEGMFVMDAGADYALLRVRDELGVGTVQMWPLER